MSEPALKLVRDLGGDWDENQEAPLARTAAEAAAAVPDEAKTGSNRARTRQRPSAPARVKSSVLLLPPIWSALVAELGASMRASATAGPPWEVQPPSISGLHDQVMRRSDAFAGLPAVKAGYVVLGHLCALAAAACYWAGWSFFGSPGRLALTLTLLIVLRATGVLPHVSI
jgi:hypothetical protein